MDRINLKDALNYSQKFRETLEPFDYLAIKEDILGEDNLVEIFKYTVDEMNVDNDYSLKYSAYFFLNKIY